MEELPSLWSYQESIDELKFKIHHTALELEAVKAIANEEININTDSMKQLLELVRFVRHERDEARDQIQKLLSRTTPSINNAMIFDYFMTDIQVHQHYQNSLMKSAKANSSIAESNSLCGAYNHISTLDFSNMIKTNTSHIQDYRHERMFSNGLQALGSVPETDYATLMMDSMIIRKVLPQKGNLLQAVMEAGPLLQTLLLGNPLPSFSQMTVGDGGGSVLSFDHVNFSNFGSVEKRQRFQ